MEIQSFHIMIRQRPQLLSQTRFELSRRFFIGRPRPTALRAANRSPRAVRPDKFTCRSPSQPQTSEKGISTSTADLRCATAATRDPKMPHQRNGRPTPSTLAAAHNVAMLHCSRTEVPAPPPGQHLRPDLVTLLPPWRGPIPSMLCKTQCVTGRQTPAGRA